jgi:hypothetical protein
MQSSSKAKDIIQILSYPDVSTIEKDDLVLKTELLSKVSCCTGTILGVSPIAE